MNNKEQSYKEQMTLDAWQKLMGELWPNNGPYSKKGCLSKDELVFLANLKPVSLAQAERSGQAPCVFLVIRDAHRIRFSGCNQLINAIPRRSSNEGDNDIIVLTLVENFDNIGLCPCETGTSNVCLTDIANKSVFNTAMFLTEERITILQTVISIHNVFGLHVEDNEPVYGHSGDFLPIRPAKFREFRRSSSLPKFSPKLSLDAWRKDVSRIWGNPWEWNLSKRAALQKLTALMNLQPVLPCTHEESYLVAITFLDRDKLESTGDVLSLAIPRFRNYSGENAVTIFFRPIHRPDSNLSLRKRVEYYTDNAAILSVDAKMPVAVLSSKNLGSSHYRKIFNCYKACCFSIEEADIDGKSYDDGMCKDYHRERQDSFLRPNDCPINKLYFSNSPKIVELSGEAVQSSSAYGNMSLSTKDFSTSIEQEDYNA